MNFGAPDPVIFGPLKVYRQLKPIPEEMLLRTGIAEQQGIPARLMWTCAPTRSRSRQVALGTYAKLLPRKLPRSRLEAFQSTLVKPAPALLLCSLRLNPEVRFVPFFPKRPIVIVFLDVLILARVFSPVSDREGCAICELIQRGQQWKSGGSKAALYSL